MHESTAASHEPTTPGDLAARLGHWLEMRIERLDAANAASLGQKLQQRALQAAGDGDEATAKEAFELACLGYKTLADQTSELPLGAWLQTAFWLAIGMPLTDTSSATARLNRCVEMVLAHPPGRWEIAALGLSPLMRHAHWPLEGVFPIGRPGLNHPHLIVPLLDLANFAFVHAMAAEHPLAADAAKLSDVFGGTIDRLSLLEEDPTRFGDDAQTIQRVLSDAIALATALAATLGSCGHVAAVGKLYRCLDLQHRGLQAEAAAALCRLGDAMGREALVRLAADPMARPRVLRYAEEIGCLDAIAPEHRSELAMAESQLGLWLASPAQYGFPPHSLELVDQRQLAWPSYEAPQACYLFRYRYRFPSGDMSNIGMAGPLVHAVASDLAELAIPDIYALFAGWQAEHPEIFEVDASQFNDAQRRLAQQLSRHLEDQGHADVQPQWLGFLVGEVALAASSHVDHHAGHAVTDGLETVWFPAAGRPRPLGLAEAYWVFKGRKLLRTFNGPDALATEM